MSLVDHRFDNFSDILLEMNTKFTTEYNQIVQTVNENIYSHLSNMLNFRSFEEKLLNTIFLAQEHISTNLRLMIHIQPLLMKWETGTDTLLGLRLPLQLVTPAILNEAISNASEVLDRYGQWLLFTHLLTITAPPRSPS